MITVVFVSQNGDGKALAATAMASERSGRHVRVVAAATSPGDLGQPEVMAALRARGYHPGEGRTLPIRAAMAAAADLVVSIGATVECAELGRDPDETWLVPDATSAAAVEVMLDLLSMGVDAVLKTAAGLETNRRRDRDPLTWPAMEPRRVHRQ
ncbi:MAG: hypothetical protein ACYDAC_00700 [Candidatus Dormibacteria bacterium]